jgi:hypothetical protein
MGESFEKLEILFSHGEGQFTPEELIEITEAFSKIEPVDQRLLIRETAEVLPQWVIFVLGYIGGEVSSGFFSSIGTDLYNKAKETVKKAFKSKTELNIGFELHTKDTEIKIQSQPKNEATIDKIFDTIDEAKEVAIAELEKADTPKLTELVIDAETHTPKEGMNKNLKDTPKKFILYEYDEQTGKWTVYRDYSPHFNELEKLAKSVNSESQVDKKL